MHLGMALSQAPNDKSRDRQFVKDAPARCAPLPASGCAPPPWPPLLSTSLLPKPPPSPSSDGPVGSPTRVRALDDMTAIPCTAFVQREVVVWNTPVVHRTCKRASPFYEELVLAIGAATNPCVGGRNKNSNEVLHCTRYQNLGIRQRSIWQPNSDLVASPLYLS